MFKPFKEGQGGRSGSARRGCRIAKYNFARSNLFEEPSCCKDADKYKKKKTFSSILSAMQLPYTIWSINSRYLKPEIVSIGPLHSKKSNHLLQFEELRWFFVEKFLHRCEAENRDLVHLLQMKGLEARTRDFYSYHQQISDMPSQDLLEIMLLDGSFLIELLEVLKLENQLPLFVLTSLSGQPDTEFIKLALEFFNLSWTGPGMTLPSELPDCSHLLELFYWSSVKPLSVNHCDEQTYASTHSMQCVTEVKLSGIEFKQRQAADTFLDIKYKNRVLQIPAITFNEIMNAVLTNCVALEQSRECHIKYFCNYVSFFSCLISQPEDVSSLSLDGIISKFSNDDQAVASFINDLIRNMGCVRYSYLSDGIKNVRAYYNSDWASLMRNYFVTK
ncbi:UPF0481 protein At3g47200-like [Mangifera indica]|uniref:UPF0481 protein At3g47200-like n=1 Tax=Mangifera indica TaxID=29780 RepID=UPI001CF99990|nr:UPF0481 protein At3g47200-like [Mangifera indica]